jgi:hypothetical protein
MARVGFRDHDQPWQAGRSSQLRQHEDDRCWPVELLAQGHYAGTDDAVLRVCADQLNVGAADVVDLGVDIPLGRLIDAALVAQLRPRRPAPDRPEGVRIRSRTRGSTFLATVLTETDQLRVRPSASASPWEWLDRLGHVHTIWGDGWVLRQAVAAVPAAVDLTAVAGLAAPDLAAVLSAEAERRSNRGNTVVWRQQHGAAATSLDRRCWVFSVLAAAHTTVVTGLAEEIDAATADLAPKHFRCLEAAVAAFRSPGLSRELLLRDPLRLNQVRYSARSLWLLRVTASQSNLEQIDKKVAVNFTELLIPGMGDRRQVMRTLGTAIRSDRLRGAREALPGVDWRVDNRTRSLTAAVTDQVLVEPDQWPVEIVGDAVRNATTRLSRLDTIAQVADEKRWFQTPEQLGPALG